MYQKADYKTATELVLRGGSDMNEEQELEILTTAYSQRELAIMYLSLLKENQRLREVIDLYEKKYEGGKDHEI